MTLKSAVALKRSLPMLLTEDFLEQWGKIVDQVEKQHVPIHFVSKVIFRTANRRQKTINLQRLRDSGVDREAVELAVESFIRENEDQIHSMEFIIDIRAVAKTVQPETDRLLKDV